MAGATSVIQSNIINAHTFDITQMDIHCRLLPSFNTQSK